MIHASRVLLSRNLVVLLLCAVASLAPGCGGGSVSSTTTTTTTTTTTSNPPSNAVGISGTWSFKLSYDQAAALGANVAAGTVTKITVPLTQDVAGSTSTLSSSSAIVGSDLGCKAPTSSWIAVGAGTRADFTITSGTLQSSAVNLTLHEFSSATLPPGVTLAEGNMTFMGTLNPDGTMSGSMMDTCVLDASNNAKQGTWTATKIS